MDLLNGFNTTTTGAEAQLDGFLENIFALGGFFIALAILLILICLAVVVLIIVANCRINVKAGEKWWKAIVPLYNSWIQIKIAGLAWYWFPIFIVVSALFVPTNALNIWTYAMLLVAFNVNYNMAKKFGKSNAFAFWCTVLPFVFLPILAFGSAKYNKGAEVDPNGVFSIKK